jgi:hypothetical protein
VAEAKPVQAGQIIDRQFRFDGEWVPDHDPAQIGENNFAELTNFRYIEGGIEPIEGYTKITNNPMDVTYKFPASAIQLRTPHTTRSYVLVHAWDSGETAARIWQNSTAIPSQGDFSATSLFTPDTSGVLPRFAQLPRGIGYTNEFESCIWEGEEALPGAVFLIDSITGLTTTNSRDYTEELTNNYQTSGNTCLPTGSALTFLIGVTRPIKGAKFYVKTANTSAGATMAVTNWTSGAWTAVTSPTDNTAVAGITLAQTGTITFDSTVGTTDAAYIDGVFLYFYKFTMSGSTATDVYKITIDMPFQAIKDVWDGVYRTCIGFHAILNNTAFADYTVEVNTESNEDYPITGKLDIIGTHGNDVLEIVSEERSTAIRLEFIATKVNGNAITTTVKYWDGDSWVSVGTIYDGTLDSGGTKTMNQSGVISWKPPAVGSERTRTRWGVTGYFYQLTFSGAASADVQVDLCTLIPAQRTIYGHKYT